MNRIEAVINQLIPPVKPGDSNPLVFADDDFMPESFGFECDNMGMEGYLGKKYYLGEEDDEINWNLRRSPEGMMTLTPSHCAGGYAVVGRDMCCYCPWPTKEAGAAIMKTFGIKEVPNTTPEYFLCRGIGKDVTPGCFVCGGEEKLYANIAAFVRSKDAGMRIVSLFETGARLDYRPKEPEHIQVKIGACDSHLENLELLSDLVLENDRISRYMIEMVQKTS